MRRAFKWGGKLPARAVLPTLIACVSMLAVAHPLNHRNSVNLPRLDPSLDLSIVAVGRNDDYGHRFLDRLHLFVVTTCAGLARHAIAGELILVDWNGPSGRESLSKAVSRKLGGAWPRGCPVVRVIEVPPHVHNKRKNADQIALFEYIAKNAGVRRARGLRTLVTNPDVFFSDSLFAWLAEKRGPLGERERATFYRADRWDFVGPDFDKGEALPVGGAGGAFTVEDQKAAEEYAEERLFEVRSMASIGLGGMVLYGVREGISGYSKQAVYLGAEGSDVPFGLARVSDDNVPKEKTAAGGGMYFAFLSRPVGGSEKKERPALEKIGSLLNVADPVVASHPVIRAENRNFVDVVSSMIARLPRDSYRALFGPSVPERCADIHVQAPGDFLLMPTEAWHIFRGFPEVPGSSTLDSVMSLIAAAAGFEQVILDPRLKVFHMEHDRGEQISRPHVPWDLFLQNCEALVKNVEQVKQGHPRSTMVANEVEWGLRDEDLVELVRDSR